MEKLSKDMVKEIFSHLLFPDLVHILITSKQFSENAEEYYHDYFDRWTHNRLKLYGAEYVDVKIDEKFERALTNCTEKEILLPQVKLVSIDTQDIFISGPHCGNEDLEISLLSNKRYLLTYFVDEWSCGYYYSFYTAADNLWDLIRFGMDDRIRSPFLKQFQM